MNVPSPIAPGNLLGEARPASNSQTLVDRGGETFAKLFNDVNELQLAADRKMEEFATSGEKDMHGTMIALQKADLSLRLLLQVRSKLTSAYQEIMRMQV
jgi:flagellar hook-basal body complex protein FliE